MDDRQHDPGTRILDLLLTCHTAAKRVAEHADLSTEEVLCLFVLQERRPENVKALSNHLGVRSSRMSKILFSLEQRGFVVRSIAPVDHRMEEVTLTPRGADRIADILRFARSLAPGFPASDWTSVAALPTTSMNHRG